MMSTLLKLGLSGYEVKPRFGAFQCEDLLQNPPFLGENFGGTRHPYEKNEPILDHSGGGWVHGKTCWLIAYIYHGIITLVIRQEVLLILHGLVHFTLLLQLVLVFLFYIFLISSL